MSEVTSAPAAGAPELYDLVWFPNGEWCDELAAAALEENWDDDGSGRHPILFNYFKYYARRAREEGVWIEATSPAGARVSAFDTGLLSRHFGVLDVCDPLQALGPGLRDHQFNAARDREDDPDHETDDRDEGADGAHRGETEVSHHRSVSVPLVHGEPPS
jgi:hypothetical protein